eukprot:6775865-Prorocentrum_lima.AAC.1
MSGRQEHELGLELLPARGSLHESEDDLRLLGTAWHWGRKKPCLAHVRQRSRGSLQGLVAN